MNAGSTIQDLGFWIQDTESRILNPELGIQNPEVRDQDSESWISIQDPEFRFRIQDLNSLSRIRILSPDSECCIRIVIQNHNPDSDSESG